MKSIERNCSHCNKIFRAPIREVNRGNGRFCNKTCACSARKGQQTKSRQTIQCSFCQKELLVTQGELNRTQRNTKNGLRFCGQKCHNKAQRIIGGIPKVWPAHYGLESSTKYRKTAFAFLPQQCVRCGYSKILGVLQVHHKDRNRKNNKIENLEILCPTCHQEEHFKNRDGLYNKLHGPSDHME